MTRLAPTVASISLILVGTSSLALAWDSDRRPATQAFPTTTQPLVPKVYASDLRSLNGTLRYQMGVTGTVLGGPEPDGADDSQPVGLYACNRGFIVDGDLGKCQLASPAQAHSKSFGWSTARQVWNGTEQAEHYLIARLTAQVAGLLNTTLFDRFWVRYPGLNSYVSSTFETSPSASYTELVGQSLQPTDWEHLETHAMRGISLLDLAQLPDFSSSADDWLLGNETCPIAGTSGAYAGVSEINSCHELTLTMGAVNATHFAPMNREVFTYYHGLAKNQMVNCASLSKLIPEFYDRFNNPSNFAERPFSVNDTEAHECERRAFMYEMIAQHFLEDAWSTGHMFKRWGYVNYRDFPTDVLLPGETEYPLYELGNRPARRAGIALSLAAFAGTIHGAKSVVFGKARDLLGVTNADFLEQHGYFDDPLSGPFFTLAEPFKTTQQLTSWTDGTDVFAGAGDMFWNPSGPHASVLTQTEYDNQRATMLGCAAASMLDVYATPGPDGQSAVRANGVPSAPRVKLIQPLSDECWEHWATNQTMLGAIGPVDLLNLLYKGQVDAHSVAIPALLLGIANSKIIDDRADVTPNFPRQKEATPDDSPDMTRAIEDRDKFLQRLTIRADLDFIRMTNEYAYNATQELDGDQSAHNLDADGHDITLLNIGPVSADDVPLPIPAVDYVDRPDLSDVSRRVFWRSDLYNVCRESTTEDASVLLGLRDRCRSLAPQGGDSDACTACVDLAELHIPTCLRFNPKDTFHSKCSVVGAEDVDSPPPGLPAWWFNVDQRVNATIPHDDGTSGDPVDCGFQSYFVALRWCTDTEQTDATVGDLTATHVITTGAKDICGDTLNPPTLQRLGVASLEVESSGVANPFMRPMVTAFERTVSLVENSGPPCSSHFITSEDAIVKTSVAPAQLWDNESQGVMALASTQDFNQLAVPRCGTLQRFSLWNRDCLTALGQLGSNMNLATSWNPATGEQFTDLPETASCLVREARTLVSHCPGSMTCTAGGQCTPAGFVVHPRVVVLDSF